MKMASDMKVVICFLFVSISVFVSVCAQSNSDTTCVNDIIAWCENQDYRNGGQSDSQSSTSNNGSFQVVRCLTNSRGTSCTKNGNPWIRCSTDHKATYKGTVLRKNSARGADGEVCDAARFVNTESNTKVVFKECFPFCDGNPFGEN